jgi:DNA-binding response OmpR family regulator
MKRQVLIVDDEFGLAEVISDLLTERGFHVLIAMNGKIAWDLMEQTAPQLILLDMMMPVMDGPTLLQRMRKDARFATIPVVMMSSLPATRFQHLHGLYQAAVRKPFSPEQLFALVEQHISDA